MNPSEDPTNKRENSYCSPLHLPNNWAVFAHVPLVLEKPAEDSG